MVDALLADEGGALMDTRASVINQMLRDLQRRSALVAEEGAVPPRYVAPVERGRDAPPVRRVLYGLLFLFAPIGLIGYQIGPAPALLTGLALQTDTAAAAIQPSAPAQPRLEDAVPSEPIAESEPLEIPPLALDDVPPLPPLVEGLRLAYSIETPVGEHPRATQARAPTATPRPAPLPEAVPPESAPRVVRRESAGPTSAQMEVRRAMLEIQQGRAGAAEELLMNALARDAGNEAARQALAALLLDQRRLPEAAAVLEQGLAINPRHARFAFALARMQVDGRDYAGALRTLAPAAEGNESDADLQSLLGTVLQRLSRHAEAVEHYEQALRASPNNATAWIGLGLSLEALQRRDAAAEAFNKALASGTLTAEARAFIEEKTRQPR